MLKWTLGNKVPPTPGSTTSPESNCKQNEHLHVARNQKCNVGVRKASIRALRRLRENKENINIGSPIKRNGGSTPLLDVSNSNSPASCDITPRRRFHRRQSHPLRFSLESCDENESANQLKDAFQLDNACEILDTRKPSSTIKSFPAMQIEYSPGPLSATQSLLTLRRRLTHSMQEIFQNPINFARGQQKLGVTINSDSSPSFESILEEKSLFEQTQERTAFLSTKNNKTPALESTLVSSLSQRLEWLRLNNSLSNTNNIRITNQGITVEKCKNSRLSDDDNFEENMRRVKRRRKAETCDSPNIDDRQSIICDSKGTKTELDGNLIGLTLPMGIPSPSVSDDSGLSSIQGLLEGIHPLNSSPDRPALKETLLSSLYVPQSTQSSLIVHKYSPTSSSTTLKTSPQSSIGSSCRKRLINDEELELNASVDEMVPIRKTPRIAAPGSQVSETSSSTASPLAMVEKRSRSRRCLLFVSPGLSRRKTSIPSSVTKPVQGEIELRVAACDMNTLTIYIGRGKELHKSGGRRCNAYAKVALVPSNERTFFRTPVQRESSCPNFDEQFSYELQPEDINKRILVSVWHRDRDNRKSEFLGCVSLSVKNVIKKEIVGSFRLASQPNSRPGSARPSSPEHAIMARRTECGTGEEVLSVDVEDDQRCPSREDTSFLRHLELESDVKSGKPGRTLFTITKCLSKTPGTGFGLSIAWTQPPRIERVEPGQAADRAGIRPGDLVIFVDKYNVVTMSEEQVLQIIKSCGNELNLEIYRKTSPNGVVEPTSWPSDGSSAISGRMARQQQTLSPRSAGTTATSYDISKRRLHLPHVAFSTESSNQDARRRTLYQLLNKELQYAINLQFGVNKFLLPLSERKDMLSVTEHHTLFQNIEELLRLTEDIIEQANHDDIETVESFLSRVYLKKIGALTTAYRKYCSGIKRADCLLAEKSKSNEFTRFCSEPAIPKKRPDLTTFLHKPLEHYREVLRLMTVMLNQSKSSDEDNNALNRIVHELQTSYREATSSTGLMEPEVEGRPLLSVQDLESRLVFTRCKPFVLSVPGRQWIFGGDLSRVEGRAVRQFWALLFTDILIFAKVSRDRVLFITDEPLSLISISQAFFNIRKKATEFRLLVNSNAGTDSPATATCGPDLALTRTPRKGGKTRTIALRAPNPELKAVWQNLIQRQIIYLNTARGGTPASSPIDSPDPPTTLTMSAGTLDSLSIKRQVRLSSQQTYSCSPHHVIRKNTDIDDSSEDVLTPTAEPEGYQALLTPDSSNSDTPVPEKGCFPTRSYTNGRNSENTIKGSSTKQLNDLIDHKCRQLGKTKTSKGGAMHLAEWMKGQLGAREDILEEPVSQEPDPDHEIWTQEQIKKKTTQLQVSGYLGNRNESRCEEIDLASERSVSRNTERSHQSYSTSESQTTVKSNPAPISVCRKCRDTCLRADSYEDDDYDDTWGNPLKSAHCTNSAETKDPFIPSIAVMPPTPDKCSRNAWDLCSGINNKYYQKENSVSAPTSPVTVIIRPHSRISEIIEGDEDEDTPEGSVQSSDIGLPYRTLSSSLKRFGTLASLERIGSTDFLDEEEEEELTNPAKDGNYVFYSPPPVRASLSKIAPEVIQRNWTSVETTNPQPKSWSSRAGSFVAEKMAIFERLSAGETTTIKKTSFLDRYLKPSSENHLDSPPDPGTNTSSSGRGEEEGETSGATSGEEVWGTPTSDGEFDEELAGESTKLAFVDSPHGSSEDDTEQLMEDLLTSLPMLAARTPGLTIRRRLEPLLEEEDIECLSTPCSPKPSTVAAAGQGYLTIKSPNFYNENSIKFNTNSTERPLGSQKKNHFKQRIGTIDRALGIRSDEDEEDEEEPEKTESSNQSILQRLGLRKNKDDSSKARKLEYQDSQMRKTFTSMQTRMRSMIPNLKDLVDEIPRPPYLNANLLKPPILRVRMRKLVSQLRRNSPVEPITIIPSLNPYGRSHKRRIRNAIVPFEIMNNFRKKRDWLGSPLKRPLKRSNGIRRAPHKFAYLGFLSNKKTENRMNSAAYGGRPLFKYLFNRDTVDDIPTTLPRPFHPIREDRKQIERRFWKQLRKRRSSRIEEDEKSDTQLIV